MVLGGANVSTQLCFAEPGVDDPRKKLPFEDDQEFLTRSTWGRAAEIRRFYNRNLRSLPEHSRTVLCHRLRADHFGAARFEMVVGRFLQLLGASDLVHEPVVGDRRLDWRATFSDSTLHVEAMTPAINASAARIRRQHVRVVERLRVALPDGWLVMPIRLPAIPGHESVAPVQREVERLLSTLPEPETFEHGRTVLLEGRTSAGASVRIMVARRQGTGRIGSSPMIATWDDSRHRIKAAWLDQRKRDQGRSAPAPALLAIESGWATDWLDFESALFGMDIQLGRRPDGVMALDQNPPWAGVLAFGEVSEAGSRDPVLFLSPRSAESLPAAIGRLATYSLESGVVMRRPPRDTDVLSGLGWIKL